MQFFYKRSAAGIRWGSRWLQQPNHIINKHSVEQGIFFLSYLDSVFNWPVTEVKITLSLDSCKLHVYKLHKESI